MKYIKILWLVCAIMFTLATIVFLAGCNVQQAPTSAYGVSCDQFGHLSMSLIYSNGQVESMYDHTNYADMNPPAQTCSIQSDGSIVVRPLVLK